MPNRVSIVGAHGIGHGDVNPSLRPSWTKAITEAIQRWIADAEDLSVDCQMMC
jgi:hypothetical protein